MWNWFIKQISSQRIIKPLISALIFSIISSTLVIGIPYFLKFIINDILPKQDIALVLTFSLILLLLYIVSAIAKWFEQFNAGLFNIRLEIKLKNRIFEKLTYTDLEYFEKNLDGAINANFDSDIPRICMNATAWATAIFRILISLLIGLILLATLSWQLTIVLLLFVVFDLLYTKFSWNKNMKISKRVWGAIAKNNGKDTEVISNVALVRTFNNFEYENNRSKNRLIEMMKRKIKMDQFYVTSLLIYNTFGNFLQVLLILVGAYLLSLNMLEVGTLIAFLMYSNTILATVDELLRLVRVYSEMYTSMQKVYQLIKYKNKTWSSKNYDFVKGDIEFRDFSFKYDSKQENALNHLNFTIKENQRVAFVGASGCGKTTTIKNLLKLYHSNHGNILVGGINIDDIAKAKYYENVGYLSQKVNIINDTVYNNIAYGSHNASKPQIIKAAKQANIHKFICELENGYDTILTPGGSNLSGGQKQRISIARVILKDPQILILDEATSALDNITENNIMQEFAKISENKTTIIIAHRLSTISFVDEIFVFDKGRMIESGNHEQLRANKGKFYELEQNQIK